MDTLSGVPYDRERDYNKIRYAGEVLRRKPGDTVKFRCFNEEDADWYRMTFEGLFPELKDRAVYTWLTFKGASTGRIQTKTPNKGGIGERRSTD